MLRHLRKVRGNGIKKHLNAQNTNRPPDEGKYYLASRCVPYVANYRRRIYSLLMLLYSTLKISSGTNHENWDTILGDPNDPDDDKLILLFDKPDPDKCLGKIH